MNMRKVYQQIAKKYGVSVEEVEREMQAAIDMAYKSNTNEVTHAYQQKVPKKGEIPTTEELILYIVSESKK